jgi:hypothetical protein
MRQYVCLWLHRQWTCSHTLPCLILTMRKDWRKTEFCCSFIKHYKKPTQNTCLIVRQCTKSTKVLKVHSRTAVWLQTLLSDPITTSIASGKPSNLMVSVTDIYYILITFYLLLNRCVCVIQYCRHSNWF